TETKVQTNTNAASALVRNLSKVIFELRTSILDRESLHRAIWMIVHLAVRACSLHRNFELGMYLGIFVFILDLIAALFHALVDVRFAACLGLIAAPADGEEEDRLGAAVEMLMEPHFRRHEHASRPPLDAFFRFAFLPHERVTMSSDDQNVNAGSVTMRFFVRADAPELDRRFDRSLPRAKDRALSATAAVEAAGIGLAHAHVGDEVGLPLLRRRLL